MAKQQISKHAKEVSKGDAAGTSQPARADGRQARQRRPSRRAAAEKQRGASTAATGLREAVVDSSTTSTGGKTTGRAAPQPGAKSRRGGATAASGADRPPASTKRAVLIGMLERAEGASVAEIGQRLGWLPHTVRAAITGLRHAGREVTRGKYPSGQSVYRLVSVETPDR
jgi:hypothetical protein